MKKFAINVLAMSAALGTSILLSGCGEDLSERPFVMTCKIEDRPYNAASYSDAAQSDDTFDLQAGGLNLPNNAELERRGGKRVSYFQRGFLTDQEGELDSAGVVTLPMIDRSSGQVLRMERSGWYEVNIPQREGRGRMSVAPIGWVDIEHFTLNASGELTPVNFQLTSLGITDQGRSSSTRQADIGAKLPADARYSVYKYTVRNVESNYVDADRSLTTYWVVPLEEKHRWTPMDWDFSQQQPKAFADYAYMVGNLSGSRPSNTYPLEDTREAQQRRNVLPERVSNRNIASRSVPCLAGTHANFRDYVSLLGKIGAHNVVEVVEYSGMWFVGFDESDLQGLPANPKDWKGADVERDERGKIYVEL